MAKLVQLRALLLQEFESGKSEEQAVKNLCRQIGSKAVCLTTARKWYKRFRAGDKSLENKLSTGSQQQATRVAWRLIPNEAFLRAHRATLFELHDWRFNKSMSTLNGHVAFYFNMCPKKKFSCLTFVDLFHGGFADVPIRSDPFAYRQGSCFSLHMVDYQHILVLERRNINLNGIYLLKFDENTWSCDVVASGTRNFEFHKKVILSFDQSNPQKFVIGSNEDYLFVDLSGDRLLFNALSSDQLPYMNGIRYDGNELSGFAGTFWRLNPTRFFKYNRTENYLAIQDASTALINKQDFYVEAYHWTEDRLYVAHGNDNCSFSIYAFELETMVWRDTGININGFISGLFVDSNSILTITASHSWHGDYQNPEKGKNAAYRFPLGRPDSLRNLAWFAIRRRFNFFGSRLYEKLYYRLPYNTDLRSKIPARVLKKYGR